MKVFVATLTTDPKEHYKSGADGPMRKDTIVNDLWLAGLTLMTLFLCYLGLMWLLRASGWVSCSAVVNDTDSVVSGGSGETLRQ